MKILFKTAILAITLLGVVGSGQTIDSLFSTEKQLVESGENISIEFELSGKADVVKRIVGGLIATFNHNLSVMTPDATINSIEWSFDGELVAGDSSGVSFDNQSLTIDFTEFRDGALLEQAEFVEPVTYSIGFSALISDGESIGSFIGTGSGVVPKVHTLNHVDNPTGIQIPKSMGLTSTVPISLCGQSFGTSSRAFLFRAEWSFDWMPSPDPAKLPTGFARVLDASGELPLSADIAISVAYSPSKDTQDRQACGSETIVFDLLGPEFNGFLSDEFVLIIVNSDQDFILDVTPLFEDHHIYWAETKTNSIGGGYALEAFYDVYNAGYSEIQYQQWEFFGGFEQGWMPIYPQPGLFIGDDQVLADLSIFNNGGYVNYDPEVSLGFQLVNVVEVDGIRYTLPDQLVPVSGNIPNAYDLSGNKLVSPSDLAYSNGDSIGSVRPLNYCGQDYDSSSFRYSFRAERRGVCTIDTSLVPSVDTLGVTVLKMNSTLSSESLIDLVTCGAGSVQFNAEKNTVYIVAANFETEFSSDWQVELDLRLLEATDFPSYKVDFASANGTTAFYPELTVSGIPGSLLQLRVSRDLSYWEKWVDFEISHEGIATFDLSNFEDPLLFIQIIYPEETN